MNAIFIAGVCARSSHELHTTHTGEPATTQRCAGILQRADGGIVWPIERTALALIHRGGGHSVSERINAVLCDGPSEAQPGNNRTSAIGNARIGRNDRTGSAVTLAGAATRSAPQALPEVVNRALRDAALAPTYIDALDVLADALLALAALAPLEGATTKAPCGFRRIHGDKLSLRDNA